MNDEAGSGKTESLSDDVITRVFLSHVIVKLHRTHIPWCFLKFKNNICNHCRTQNDRMIFPACIYITDIYTQPTNIRYSTYLSAAPALCLYQYWQHWWPRMCNYQSPDHWSSAHLLCCSILWLALKLSHSGFSMTRLASGRRLQYMSISQFVQSKIEMLRESPSLL